MNNEEMNIPASVYDHYTQINNQITALNAQMEIMEKEGREYTGEYEVLSEIEADLCRARMTIRKHIRNGNY